MNELIPIVNTEFSGSLKQAVNARELHVFLEVQTRFNDWIKNRIAEYGFVENQDFVAFTENLVNGGRRIEYHLSLDMAKELSMVERTPKGKQARQYFIECERRYKAAMPYIPQTLSEALRYAADLADKVIELQPKADALDILSERAGDLCLTDAAKNLQMRRCDLLAYMQQYRWLYKRDGKGQWIAYQPRISAGLLRHVEHTYISQSTGEERIATQVRVTPKGLAYLAKKIASKNGVKT